MITDDSNISVDRQIGEHLDKGATLVKITVTKYFAFPNERGDPQWVKEDIFNHFWKNRYGKDYLLYEHFNFDHVEIEDAIKDPVQPFGDANYEEIR